MRASRPTPGDLDGPLNASLSSRLAPSDSRVSLEHRETTVCYAYMCGYAYACTEKSSRPAQVLMRRCMRYLPDSLRVAPALSDLALDLLASQRQVGKSLSAATTTMLDRMRPDGPVRKRP